METMVTRRGFAKLAGMAMTMTALGGTRAMAAALAKPTGKVILTISGLIGNTNNGEKAEFDTFRLHAHGLWATLRQD